MSNYDQLKATMTSLLDQNEAAAREWFAKTLETNKAGLDHLSEILRFEPAEFKAAVEQMPDSWINAIRRLAINALTRAGVETAGFWKEPD
jgi:hypothetical protein